MTTPKGLIQRFIKDTGADAIEAELFLHFLEGNYENAITFYNTGNLPEGFPNDHN